MINHNVTPKQTMLQNLRYAPSVRIGVPHFALGSGRKSATAYLIFRRLTRLNASLLRARKTVNDINQPVVRPTVWHVEE
jgi:hypothetical protein